MPLASSLRDTRSVQWPLPPASDVPDPSSSVQDALCQVSALSESEDEASDSYSVDDGAVNDRPPLLSKESDPSSPTGSLEPLPYFVDDGAANDRPSLSSTEADSSSPAGLLEALTLYTDTVQVRQVPQTGLSLTDKALGLTASTTSQSSVSESPLVMRALALARRRFLTPSLVEDSGLDAPSVSDGDQLSHQSPALAPYPRRLPLRGTYWLCSAFPQGTSLSVTESDRVRLGLPKRPHLTTPVSELALLRMESASARGLITVGRMDTVLAALTSALAGGDSDPSPDPERDHRLFKALLVALADGNRFLSEILAAHHFNAVLLRRDRLLSQSVLPPAARAEARSLPVSQPFLFGSAAGRVVQEAASQASNTLAFRASLKATSTARRPAPAASHPRKAPRFSAPARRGRTAFPAARGRRPATRPKADRRPAPRSAPPARGQHPQ